jgi:hypothetical protein
MRCLDKDVLRNRNWLRPKYFECLARHQVTHVFNSWEATPSVQRGLWDFGTRLGAWVTKSFFVAGWTADLGHDWNQRWMSGIFGTQGHWGISMIATGVAGGFDGTGPLPPLNLFGGATGVQSGFVLHTVEPVPEPSILGMTLLGAATLVRHRRCWETLRVTPNPRPALDAARTSCCHVRGH